MQTDASLDTLKAIHQRRAVRQFLPQKLEKATIQELLDAAVHAPTAMHGEPWAFVVIQDKERLRRYSDRAKAELLADQQSVSLIRSAEPRAIEQLAAPTFNIFYDAGTLIVVCRKVSRPFADADCWLAAENLMLAATAKGLGTCCIGFAIPVLNSADVKRELGIAEAGAAVAPIIVGVPKAIPAPTSRKAPDILSWLT